MLKTALYFFNKGFLRHRSAVEFSKEGRVLLRDSVNGFYLKRDHKIQFDPKREIVIRNHGSSITPYDDILSYQANDDRILGKTYCGTVEHVPTGLSGKIDVKEGDTVWGLRNEAFGGAFCDYMSIDHTHLCPAPRTIPLAFAPGFMMGFYFISSCLHRVSFIRKPITRQKLKDKSILILGGGNQINFITPVLYWLKFAKVSDITVVCFEKRHEEALCLFNETTNFGVPLEIVSKSEKEFEETSIETQSKFDLVINSYSEDVDRIVEHVLPHARDHVWLFRTPYLEMMKSKGLFKGGKEFLNWEMPMRKLELNIVPVFLTNVQTGIPDLKEFTEFLNGLNGENDEISLILDRNFGFEDIVSGMEYFSKYDYRKLGDNINVVIDDGGLESVVLEGSEKATVTKVGNLNVVLTPKISDM